MYIIRNPADITKEIINDSVQTFRKDLARLETLYAYYLSKNEVKAEPKYTEKINNNIAGYIVRTVTSYFIGNPVRYLADEEIDITAITELYKKQDKASLDKGLGKDTSIFGKAYELAYLDEDAVPRSVKLSPLNTFVVFDTSAEPKSLFAVNILKLGKLYITRVYTSDKILTFEGEYGDITRDKLVDEKEHYFKRVPITLYQNNEESMGDFENVLSDIDAYNRLKTNRLDDIEKFINSLLMLKGADLGNSDEEAEIKAEKIKRFGILELPDDADAGFLTNTLNQEQIQMFADAIKEDIHMYSFVPNLSDESFANNSSGVAMRFKLLGLEQLVQDKELSFVKGLKRRLKLYKEVLLTKAQLKDFDVDQVEIQFNRNLPSNDFETAQIIQMLISSGAITKETLISQLSFVQDAAKEVENASNNNIDSFLNADLLRKIELSDKDDPNKNKDNNEDE